MKKICLLTVGSDLLLERLCKHYMQLLLESISSGQRIYCNVYLCMVDFCGYGFVLSYLCIFYEVSGRLSAVVAV